jgi:hypothetical protein
MKTVSWKLKEIVNGKEVTCGCVVDSVRYIKRCTAHQKEHDEVFGRWADDYKKSSIAFDEQCARHAKMKQEEVAPI